MAASIETQRHNFSFWDCKFIYKDSPEAVEQFEEWREGRAYKLTDGDDQGWNILMAAVRAGNTRLTRHVVKLMDQGALHMSNRGQTVFDSGHIAHESDIDKIINCFEIVIQAGADVNIVGQGANTTALERLIDRADISKNLEAKKCTKLFRFFAEAKASCQGKSDTGKDRSTFPDLLQARKEVGWPKTRNLYIPDQNSPFSTLPRELLYLINQQYSSLPDEAQPNT